MKNMINCYLQGDVREAVQIHSRLHPIFKGLFECPHRVPNPAPVKFALNHKGIEVGGVRLPLINVTEEEGRFITSLFE
ncbi:4-hydroxy-tetrahydrodipicolinate synthase [compost metagenome]